MSNLNKIKIGILSIISLPFLAGAEVTDLKSLLEYVRKLINLTIPVIFGIALVVFFWGIIKYILAKGPESVAEARNYIVLGIVAIAVMLSVWGLALIVRNFFFNGPAPVPF